MADAQRTIDLIFNGVDKTGAATLSALSNAGKFSESVQSITKPISDFTVGAVKLEAGLLAAGVAMTIFAVKTAGDFDTAFREISTIVDASDDDLAKFRAAILEYASTSSVGLQDITAALGAAIGSGVDYAKSLELIATAERLAVATRSDLGGTTKVLVSTLNSYGMEIGDAGHLSDIFFKIIDDGDIKMNDLAESFAKVAPVAKIAGIPIEEIGAAIATLTASGIKPAESIEYLRAAISNILSPSKEAGDLAEKLGIEFNATGLKANGLAGLLQQVSTATGGNAEQMKALFGSIGGFTAAATLAGPQAARFAEILKGMGDVSGSVDKAFALMSGSIDLAGQKIANAFKVMLIGIGDPLLDEFGGIATAVAQIFNALGASVKDGALKEMVAYVEGLFGQLQQTIETVAKNLPAALEKANFSGFKGGIDAVVGAFKNLFGGIDLTSVNGLTRAIELAGGAFLGLSKFAAGVIDAFKPLFDLLVRMGSNLDNVNPAFLEFAGNIGGAVVQFNALLGGITGLLPALNALVGLMVANQGLNLVGGMKAITTLLPMLTTGLTAAGVASGAFVAAGAGLAAAGVAGYGAGGLLAEGIDKVVRKLTGSESLGGLIYDFVHGTEELATAAPKAAGSLEELGNASSALTTALGDANEVSGDSIAIAKAMADPFREANRQMIEAAGASEKAAAGADKLAGAHKSLDTYTVQTVKIFDELTGKVIGYEQQLVKTEGSGRRLGETTEKAGEKLKTSADVMDVLGKKTDLTNDQLIKLAQNVKAAEIELEKIASNERIKFIEATVTLNVANIEAQTKRVEAAFESINNTITSTGDVIGKIFGSGAFDSAISSFDPRFKIIEDQLGKENALREKAFELQQSLTRAQIEQMRAQTNALTKGDGFIKIDGAGLQPHLEAFMWEILKAVQVRVNAQGLSMLLGV